MKYRYIGKTGFMLIIDNNQVKVYRNQIVELDSSKLKTRKMRQLFEEIK